MSNSRAYAIISNITQGNDPGNPGSNSTGGSAGAQYVVVSPGNISGAQTGCGVAFSYGDDVRALVTEAIQAQESDTSLEVEFL